MTRIYLIRHGETDWNCEGRYQGQTDIPLNRRGVEQAIKMSALVSREKIDAIYSSDLERARCTAQPLAQVAGLETIIDPRLREVNLGVWEGRLVDEIKADFPDLYERRRRFPAEVAPPGGETMLQVQKRLLEAIEAIVCACPEKSVAVVTHGFASAVLLTHFRKISGEQVWDHVPNNGEIQIIDI